LATTAPDSSKKTMKAKRKVDKNQLVEHMDSFMCHDRRKILESFAWETITRVRHPVYSTDLSPCDFWFFGYAKERMKNQIITSEDDLENKLIKVWETVCGPLLESVFDEWMSRLIWVIEQGGNIMSIHID
jgi:hypothetical protein